jgi:pyruvate dehydrogenase E1 component alpha subunit
MSMSVKRSINLQDLSDRAVGYGIPGETVDGNDYFAVQDAVARLRSTVVSEGPVLLVSETYRLKGHSKSDANKYRTKEEIADWAKRDPIDRFRQRCTDEKWLDGTDLDRIVKQAEEDIERAVEFAQKQEYPSVDTILDDVFAP